jgi:hypothetical protein
MRVSFCYFFLWFIAGKHLVRCQRRSGGPLVSLVTALTVPQRFKHVVRPDLWNSAVFCLISASQLWSPESSGLAASCYGQKDALGLARSPHALGFLVILGLAWGPRSIPFCSGSVASVAFGGWFVGEVSSEYGTCATCAVSSGVFLLCL